MADASVVVLGLLTDGDCRQLLRADPVAIPHIADAEIVHALRGQMIRGAITADDGSLALDRWARLGIQRFSITGLLSRMWALRGNLSGYDASYVALAESLDCGLVTADARLSRAPGPTCPITVVRQ